MSVIRYYMILKPINMRKMTLKLSLIIVGFCVLNGVVWASLPLFGWSRYSLEGALTSCSVEWKERSLNVVSYNVTIFLLVYFIPVVCTIITSIKLTIIVVSISLNNLGVYLNWVFFNFFQEKFIGKKIFVKWTKISKAFNEWAKFDHQNDYLH